MKLNNKESRNLRRFRVIAHYLPQFHPIPENDDWWGKGFTEWDNVRKANPVFSGQVQPRVPTELGYYDLREPKARQLQAELAAEHGVEGFMYWHYWMGGGKRLLERPFNEVLASKQPNFPFCLGWANHGWKGVWKGGDPSKGVDQIYPGMEDHRAHFYELLKAFRDDRYITVNGKPLFFVFDPKSIPHIKEVSDYWRDLAIEEGLSGLHLVCYTGFDGYAPFNPKDYGFDAHTYWPLDAALRGKTFAGIQHSTKTLDVPFSNDEGPRVINHSKLVRDFLNPQTSEYLEYPTALPNWDTTPRYGEKSTILHGSHPGLFREHLENLGEKISTREFENSIVFLKSWNEWGEGNYVEPDSIHGRGYLEVLRDWVEGGEEIPEQVSKFQIWNWLKSRITIAR